MRKESNSMWLSSCKICAAILSLTLLESGCGTAPKLPDYRPGATAPTARIGRDAAVEISMDPFIERHRTEQFFGIDAVGKGIGIVFVHISNKSLDRTLLVEKKNFELVPVGAAGGQTANGNKIERGTGGAQATAWLGASMASLGGLALIGFASSSISHSTEVQRNFVGKEMPDQTLAPGQAMEGFLYFTPVPKNPGWIRGAAVKVNLTETKTRQPLVMSIPLSQ
ncbi:MAG: hypothetical protein ABSG59_20000 [Verrucomicrobiota bacterium]